jgi:predicted ATPase
LLRQESEEWRWPDSLHGIGVPEGVRQLIERQLEHLSEEEQRGLEVASVAGMEFSAAAVSAGLEIELLGGEERCEAMARRTLLLQPSGMEEWPDGTGASRYGFRHALYQEVVYERLSPGRRSQLHRCIGERLEAAYGTRAGELAAELAVHFERGRDYQRAVQYCQRAATNAMQRSAYPEALSHFTRGLALLAALPESSERWQQEFLIQIALGLVLQVTKGSAATERETAYARAYALAQLHGDPLQQSLALQGLWSCSWMQGALQTARMQGEQLLVLAQQSQTPWPFFGAHRALGGAFYFLGELPLARTHLEQALSCVDLHQGYPDEFHHVQAFVEFVPAYLAFTLWLLGYADQARQRMSEAQTLAQQAGDFYGITAVSMWAMELQFLLRERQAVHTHSEQLIELATTQGFPQWLALGKLFEGWALTGQGQGEQGILQLRQGLAAFQTNGARLALPHFFSLLIDAHRMRRQWGEGLGVVADAFAVVEQTSERFYEAELWRLKGELTLQSSGRRLGSSVKTSAKVKVHGSKSRTSSSQEAEACFLKASEVARQQQAKSLELRAVMSLGRLWQRQGKKEEARQMLAEVYNWFTEGFDTRDLQEAKALIEDLEARGNKDKG